MHRSDAVEPSPDAPVSVIEDAPVEAISDAGDVSAAPTSEPPFQIAERLLEIAARPGGTLSPLVRRESKFRICVFGLAALAVAVGYFFTLHAYWAPAHGGVDQNGYLVGGKMIVDHLSTGQWPSDVYSYVSAMWIGTKWGVFYPKYPVGLPILYAIAIKLGGAAHAVQSAYLVNPFCMTLALVAVYLLVRLACGSFGALLGMLAVACSPVTMSLTNNPNSHAATLCCVAWGMYLLIRWWMAGGVWRAVGAGFLLGYALTIRYTEGLLVLPVLLVAAMNVRWTNRRSIAETVLLLAWWAIPPLALIAFNLAAFGSFTGYDSTNESVPGAAFQWQWFQRNWEPMTRQLYQTGLFWLLPFALAGLFVMFFRAWRWALVLTFWVVPSVLLYTSYYWAPDPVNPQQMGIAIGYMRFFLTVLPPLTCAAMWFLLEGLPWGPLSIGDQVHAAAANLRGFASGARPGRGVALAAGIIALLIAFGGLTSLLCSDDVAAAKRTLIAYFIVVPLVVTLAMIFAWRSRRGLGNIGLADAPRTVAATAAGILVIVACGVSATASQILLEQEQKQNLTLATAADEVTSARPALARALNDKAPPDTLRELAKQPGGLPAGSVIFSSNDQLLNHIQFVGDYRIYDDRPFNTAYIHSLNDVDPTIAQTIQPERREMLYKMLHKLNQAQLVNEQNRIMSAAFRAGRDVFVIVPRATFPAQRLRFFPPTRYRAVIVSQWAEPVQAARVFKPMRFMNRNMDRVRPEPPPIVWEIVQILPANAKASLHAAPAAKPQRPGKR